MFEPLTRPAKVASAALACMPSFALAARRSDASASRA
jgi:hypothetical protein